MSSHNPYYQISPCKFQYDYGYQQSQQQVSQGCQQQLAQWFQQSQQQSAQSNQQPFQSYEQPQQQSTADSEEESGKQPRKVRKYRTFALNFQVNNPDCFKDNAKLNVPELIDPSDPQPLIYALYSELAGAAYIKNFYAIVHDRDIDDYGQLVAKHVHILFDLANFDNNSIQREQRLTVDAVSVITGLKKQQIVFPKNEHFFNDEAAYLIHAADPFKASYAPDEVTSYCDEDLGGMSYQDLYNERSAVWAFARAVNHQKVLSEPKYLRILVHMIKLGLFGPTGRYFLAHDFWFGVYSASPKNMSAIDKACLTYNTRYQEACLHAFAKGFFGKAAVFICGKPYEGKRTLCEMITEKIKQKTIEYDIRWHSVFLTSGLLSGKRAVERYKSAQIVTFEDFRASKISPAHWGLLLDPKQTSAGEVRFVMLALNKNIIDFFKELAFKGEPINQYLHRFSYQIEVQNLSDNGMEAYKARLIPIVESRVPIYIEANPDDYLPQKIELNYSPDETQASDWMTFDQVADKVTQFVLEQCQNLGLVPGKLDVVRNINGEDINTGFGQDVNSVLLTNARIPKIPRVVVGTKHCTVDTVLQPIQSYQQLQ